LAGSVHRVVIHGETVLLDGSIHGEPLGRNLKTVSRSLVIPSPRKSILAPVLDAKSPSRTRLFSTDSPMVKFAEKGEPSSKYIADLSRSTLSIKASPFYQKHVLSVKSFERKDLHILFGVAQEMRLMVEKHGQVNLLQGKVMMSAFWEPSTRTSCSFEAAMTRLGGGVVSINQITSSIAKGESLGDTGILN
jgi:carbamoyl-phosphate synthase/aspartate carbamoyltransferase